ncbi:MAG: NAD(P)-binding protein, partial [Thermoleophilia bacterium]|nr:NAD(P)-binding protein [Thermoleophilia bacterium]
MANGELRGRHAVRTLDDAIALRADLTPGARVVIVGAGVGGLGAGVRLAAAGFDVLVLEAAAQVGGKLGIARSEGHTFDTGPSLLTMPFTLAETLATAGVELSDRLDLRRVDPLCQYQWDDGSQLATHADADATAAAFEALHDNAALFQNVDLVALPTGTS